MVEKVKNTVDMVLNTISLEIGDFIKYLKRNILWLFFALIVFMGVYGAWVFNTNPRIDTWALINQPDWKYNWAEIGRWGLLASETFWGISKYNPFVYTFFGYIFIYFSGIVYGYLFWRFCKGNEFVFSIFTVLAFLHPINAEQFYFDLQLFQIGWAYILVAIACGLAHYGITQKSVIAMVASSILSIWSFASYQAFLFIYIATVIGIFLFRYCYDETRINGVGWIKYLVAHVALFFVSTALYLIITKCFFWKSDYLNGQVLWGQLSRSEVIAHLIYVMKLYFTENSVFYDCTYSVIACLTIVLCIYDTIACKKDLFSKAIFVLAVIILQICPFLLTIYMADRPASRAMLVYPFVIGLDILLLFSRKYKFRIIRAIMCVLAVMLVWLKAGDTSRLVYTDIIRSQEDVRVATSVYDMSKALSKDKPIVVIGNYYNTLNESCVRGELIGLSALNFLSNLEPKYYFSTLGLIDSMKNLGFDFVYPSTEMFLDARVIASQMPSWPSDGCVVDAGDFIVVKLNEDEWPEEVELYAPGTYQLELGVEFLDNDSVMKIILRDHEDEANVSFAVWSEENGQDDLNWYDAVKQEDGSWVYCVDLNEQPSDVGYYIHCYSMNDGNGYILKDAFIEIPSLQ